MGIQTRTGKNEARDAEIHVCARYSGKEVDEPCIHQHGCEQSRFDDKVSHILSAQERLCDAGIESQQRDEKETRLKRNREEWWSNVNVN